MRDPSTLSHRLAGPNHLGSFRKKTFLICPAPDMEASFSLGKTLFSFLIGAIIWVCFEKRTHMIKGEKNGSATGIGRPRWGRFRHFRRPGCGASARPATICSTRVRRPEAALGFSEQSVQSADGFRWPFGASGGTPLAGMTTVFIAGWKI
jgi:hypothetical protein